MVLKLMAGCLQYYSVFLFPSSVISCRPLSVKTGTKFNTNGVFQKRSGSGRPTFRKNGGKNLSQMLPTTFVYRRSSSSNVSIIGIIMDSVMRPYGPYSITFRRSSFMKPNSSTPMRRSIAYLPSTFWNYISPVIRSGSTTISFSCYRICCGKKFQMPL